MLSDVNFKYYILLKTFCSNVRLKINHLSRIISISFQLIENSIVILNKSNTYSIPEYLRI